MSENNSCFACNTSKKQKRELYKHINSENCKNKNELC